MQHPRRAGQAPGFEPDLAPVAIAEPRKKSPVPMIGIAAAALLVAMLVDTQLAFLTGIITALFAGLLAPGGMQKALFAMVSCSVAIYGIGRYRERQSVTLAGLLVGAANAGMAVALLAYSEQPLTLRTVLLAGGCGFGGGLLTAVFAAGVAGVDFSLAPDGTMDGDSTMTGEQVRGAKP